MKSTFAKRTLGYLRLFFGGHIGAFTIGAATGLVFFLLVADPRLIDPTNTAWLLQGDDLKQHFLGWEFYRNESWTFPIGAINQLAYPFGISLSFMDSIPLMAIPFKLVAPWLPESFQYFGIWGLLCYILQGGIAALIMRHWTKNPFIIFLTALIFVTSPIMLSRMFIHTALAGHWILLLAIWALVERQTLNTTKRQLFIWTSIVSLAVMVHPYFVPMVMLPFAISLILLHKNWKQTIVRAIVPLLGMVAVFWIIGGFVVGVGGASAGGLGYYQLNLTSLVNSLDWSAFMRQLHPAEGESLNYLGLGILLLLPVTFFLFIKNRGLKAIYALKDKITLRHIFITLFVFGLIVAALSPRVFFGETLLFELDLPGKVERVWGIFQASARLFWILYYFIMLGAVVYVVRLFRKNKRVSIGGVLLLALFTCVQVVDILGSPQVEDRRHKYQTFASLSEYTPPLMTKEWDYVAKSRQHIVYFGDMEPKDFYKLSDIALKYHMTMNTGYFARSPVMDVQRFQAEQIELLLKKKADTNSNLYITKRTELAGQLENLGYDIKSMNGFYVVGG